MIPFPTFQEHNMIRIKSKSIKGSLKASSEYPCLKKFLGRTTPHLEIGNDDKQLYYIVLMQNRTAGIIIDSGNSSWQIGVNWPDSTPNKSYNHAWLEQLTSFYGTITITNLEEKI